MTLIVLYTTVCIDPTLRGKGAGTQLFTFVEKHARQKNHTQLAQMSRHGKILQSGFTNDSTIK